MNEDIFAGLWKQFRGEVKQFWGALTDDDMDIIDGQRDVLIGKLQERYGYTRLDAEAEVDRFVNEYESRVETGPDNPYTYK